MIAVAEGESFRVGERVRVLPNHACVVANLHDRLVGVSGGHVEAVLAVAARGRRAVARLRSRGAMGSSHP